MEKVYVDSLRRTEDDIVRDAEDRGLIAVFGGKDSLMDIMRELYSVAYSKGVHDQRDYENNKRRDPVNYHDGE
jgi:hypothetical protein